jgi:acyl-CoA synthetase (AMP-forming)/AMP-acid ligase II
VVGVPDERWGEAVHAYVTLRAGGNADPEELRRHCRGLLASYKCPKRVHVLADLPRTGIGKISRSRLRASAKDRNRRPTS